MAFSSPTARVSLIQEPCLTRNKAHSVSKASCYNRGPLLFPSVLNSLQAARHGEARDGSKHYRISPSSLLPEFKSASKRLLLAAAVETFETTDDEPPLLLELIGGEAAVDVVVDHFYDTLLQDPRVNYIFADTDMARQRRMQKNFLTGALGGKPFNGKSMKAAHKKLHLSDAHFDAVAENLEAALNHSKIKPEYVSQIMAVVAGTRSDVLGRD